MNMKCILKKYVGSEDIEYWNHFKHKKWLASHKFYKQMMKTIIKT